MYNELQFPQSFHSPIFSHVLFYNIIQLSTNVRQYLVLTNYVALYYNSSYV